MPGISATTSMANLHPSLKLPSPRRLAILLALASLALAGSRPLPPAAEAAIGGPGPCTQLVISDITVVRVTASSATIAWQTNCPAGGTIDYGTSTSYGLQQIEGDLGLTAHSLDLLPLDPQTTYHYRITAATGGLSVQTVDRTFVTPASSAGSPPTLLNVRVDAIDTQATIHIETTDTADSLTVNYGLTSTYSGPGSGMVSASGPRVTFDPLLTGLTANTLYHYQIVVNGNGSTYTSGDLTFRTSGSADDHVFSTGDCPTFGGGTVPIGACFGTLLCDGGTLRPDCTRCGLTCADDSTCAAGGSCVVDPQLTGNAFQCNQDSCYDGQAFRSPAAAGCWRSWPRCSANIVLKVQRDRVCDQWLGCAVSQEITNAQTGAKEDICTGFGACSSLGPGGTCNQFAGQGQCTNDPLKFCNTNADCGAAGSCITVQNASQHFRPVTYRSPDEVSKIQNLTGAIQAGLDWGGAAQVIEGQYPWFLGPQWGELVQETPVPRGDFEYPSRTLGQRGSSIDIEPFGATSLARVEPPEVRLEELLSQGQNNLNHVFWVKPQLFCSNNPDQACTSDAECGSGRCNTIVNPSIDLPAKAFTAFPNLDYFVTFRIKTADQLKTNVVRVQFVHGGGFHNLADLQVTDAWQDYRFGPINGLTGSARLRFFFLVGSGGTADAIMIDDISISPVLEIRPSEYLFPSCRLYPKEDAEACDYIDENGARYRGQTGYCLERDPKNPSICISWWPVDAIRGQENAFGIERSAGFSSGQLYYCLQHRTYLTQPNVFTDGCVDGTWGGRDHCSEVNCRNANPNPCPAGYHLDPTYTASGVVGYQCPVRGGERYCARGGERDDQCSFRCVRDVQSGSGQDAATIEYTGSERVHRGMELIEQCALISKVADFGTNQAWAARVQPSSTYRVPATSPFFPSPPSLSQQYSVSGAPNSSAPQYLIDYPFGRVTTPEGVLDPSGWPPIQVRTTCQDPAETQPLLCPVGNSPGAVVGAPAPYAWTDKAGSGSTVVACSPDRDAVCSSNSYCEIGSRTCTGSPATACTSDYSCNLTASCTFPAGTTGNCVDASGNSTGTSCSLGVASPDAACNVGVTCENVGGISQCSNNMGVGQAFRTSSDGHGFCASLQDGSRVAGQTCTRDYECATKVGYCRERIDFVGPLNREVTIRRCYDLINNQETSQSCNKDSDCSSCILPQLCTTADECYANSCQPPSGTTGTCPGGAPCTNRTDCFGDTCPTPSGTCRNGSLAGQLCTIDADCVGRTCNSEEGQCQVRRTSGSGWNVENPGLAVDRLSRLFTSQYGTWYLKTGPSEYPQHIRCPGPDPICATLTAAGNTTYLVGDDEAPFATVVAGWHPPFDRCPVGSDGRPTRPDPSVGNDFCGVPPEIFNERWAGGQTAITPTRGQQATLEFNTRADAEQLPLRQVLIDWKGDGSEIRTYPFPYAPKSNETDPHVLRYVYTNTSLSAVTYQPRALVIDNWGWCNNGIAGDPCLESVGSWETLNVQVTVQ